LKARLAEFFSHQAAIRRAYLTRVALGPPGTTGVTLGLHTDGGVEKTLIEPIATIFASLFSAKEHLDIVFLTDMQEAELARVCEPFHAPV
jgi:hypothetical protein